MWVQPNYFLGAIAGSLVSGIFGSSSAKKAARSQRKAAERQAATIKEQYEKSEKAFKPYTKAGRRGLAEYERMLGDQAAYEPLIVSDIREPFKFGAAEFEQYKDPGYDFRLAEGERAYNRGMAGLGKRISGERAAGLMEYGQRMGSQEFGAARGRAAKDYASQVAREQQTYDRSLGTYGRQYTQPMAGYGGLAEIGQSSVASLANIGAGAASGTARAYGAAGEARAAGTLGQAGAWAGSLRDIGQQFTGTGSTAFGGGWGGAGQPAPTGTWQSGGGFLTNLPG